MGIFQIAESIAVRGPLLALVWNITTVYAQQPPPLPGNYPNRPVRVVIGSSTGGGTDIMARLVITKLGDRWRRAFVMENRASGIGGVVAIDLVANAIPDGYTLLVSSGASITNAALVSKVSFDMRKAFAPISQFNFQPYIFAAALSLPVTSIRDLIAYAKAKPGVLNSASSGTGSTSHLGLELFNSMAGVRIVHIPYKGIGPGIIDLIGGRIELLFGSTISVIPHLKNGKLKALAVTSLKRSQAVPDLPTVSESGVPGFELIGWYGVLAPAATPPAIVRALNREITQVLSSPDVRQALLDDGADVVLESPEQFREAIIKELDKWQKLIKESNLKL